MTESLFTRIRAFFARDEFAFWWREFTDEEKKLRRMDAWELAKVINKAKVHNNNAEKRIVAEHMLSERLARIQARPTYIAIIAGLIGVVGGAFLTSALQPAHEPSKCICECQRTGTGEFKEAETIAPMSTVDKPSKRERIQDVSKSSEESEP